MKLVNSHTKFYMYNDSLPKLSYRLYSRLNEIDAYTPYGQWENGTDEGTMKGRQTNDSPVTAMKLKGNIAFVGSVEADCVS
jgi:hypothetical protein